jgi:hypothetical protein
MPRQRKFLLLTALGFAAGLLVIGGYRLFSSNAKDRGNDGITPYTTVLRETVQAPDGKARLSHELTHAMRGDGSFVRRVIFSESNRSERTIQLASGVEITIDDSTGLKSTMGKKVNPARLQRDPDSKCVNSLTGAPMNSAEFFEGEELINGYRSARIALNGQRRITYWFALDHGCALVRDRIDFEDKAFSEHNLIRLVPGQPGDALFHVPAQAREVKPSERLLSAAENRGACPSGAECEKMLRNMDVEYDKRHPK